MNDPVPDYFYSDGSLRDIYVLDATPVDWERMLNFVRSEFGLYYSYRGKSEPMPPVELVLERMFGQLLEVKLGSLVLNCHFFTLEEIEFDLQPNDVQSVEDVEKVYDFMRRLGRALQKDVVLTPENYPHVHLVRYVPATGELDFR